MTAHYREIQHRNDWPANLVAALLVVVGIFAAFDVASRVDFEAIEAQRAEKIRQHDQAVMFARGWRDCPPPADGLTDQVVMTIRSISDDQPVVTSCVRIAERQYTPRRPEVAAR